MGKGPIFIGGTGRSGTTALQRILGLHPGIFAATWETQFIVAKDGLMDLIAAGFDPRIKERFLTNLRGRWFRRVMNEGKRNEYVAGLCVDITGEEIERAITRLERDLQPGRWSPRRLRPLERHAIGARLVDAVMRPAVERKGARRWSEKTPRNIFYIDELWRMYPSMRFLHIIRDGRDVVASMVHRQFWPVAASNDIPETTGFRGEVTFEKAARYWVTLLDVARERAAALPSESYLELRLEDLIRERHETLARVCGFLGEEPDPALLTYDLSKGHVGRWKQDLGDEDAALVTKLTGEALAREGYEV